MARSTGSVGSVRDKKEAAAKVYNLVRADIQTFLKSTNPPPTPLRRMRSDLWDDIARLCERWYRRGCRRGYMETRDHFDANGDVPKKFIYDYKRHFFHRPPTKGRIRGTVTKK